MKNLLLFIVSSVVLLQADAQHEADRVLRWSIGQVELIRGEQVQVRYPLMVAINQADSRPQLGTSTLRFFYDAGYLADLQIQNVAPGYDISGLLQSKDVFGDVFGFAGGGGIFAQFDILADQLNPLNLSTEAVHVLDFSFTVRPGAQIPLCASLVLDNKPQPGKRGKNKDAGYLVNDGGIVGTYFLNNNTQKAWLADDEVDNYLWERNTYLEGKVEFPGDKAGFFVQEKSRSCIEPDEPISAAEWLDFKVFRKEDRQVSLEWMTASEFNNDFFEVQRSADNFTFEPIGNVKGKWNATSASSYDFLDEQPMPGPNYYRLKRVDKNGNIEYSAVHMVHIDAATQTGGLEVFYYPNPTKGITRIMANTAFTDHHLLVFDALGRIVVERQGVDSDTKLDFSNLESGVYKLTLKNADHEIVSSQTIVLTE